MMYNKFKEIAKTCTTLAELKSKLADFSINSFINQNGDLWAGREVRYGHMTRWEQWTAKIENGKITTWCCP